MSTLKQLHGTRPTANTNSCWMSTVLSLLRLLLGNKALLFTMLLSEFVYLLRFFCKLRCKLIPHILVCELLPRPTLAYFIFLYRPRYICNKQLETSETLKNYALCPLEYLQFKLFTPQKCLYQISIANCWNNSVCFLYKTCAIMLSKLFVLLICKNYKKRLNYLKTFFFYHL